MKTKIKKDSEVVCFHCLTKVNKNLAIKDFDGEKELYFCCSGCKSVYYIIKGGGFDSFYDRRDGFKPGPPPKVQVSEELFLDDVKPIENDEFELTLFVTNIRCASCIWLIENYLIKQDGILYVRVNYATHKMKIIWDNRKITIKDILTIIQSLGYCPLPLSQFSSNEMLHREKKNYFYRLVISLFFTMQIMIFSFALYAGYFQGIEQKYKYLFQILTMFLSTPVVFYSGWPFIKNSISSFRHRKINMDILVFLSSFTAYFYSVVAIFVGKEVFFDTASMIITLILVGRYIEVSAKLKAAQEINLLFSLMPKQAKYLGESFTDKDFDIKTCEVKILPITKIKKGGFVLVDKDEIVPVDGEVVYGSSEVDESLLTGEAYPIVKKKGEHVFAGTKNLSGKLVVKTIKDSNEFILSKIIDAIQQAQDSDIKVQSFANKFIGFFVPTIILVALLTFSFWMIYSNNFITSLMNSVSVLAIACPCALGLATPLALLVAIANATKHGVIIKNGNILELLPKANNFFFDKTGTLTLGRPEVLQIKCYSGDENYILKVAASMERFSKHVIAKAILSKFVEDFIDFEAIEEIPGRGVFAKLNNNNFYLGNLKFLQENGVAIDDKILDDFQYYANRGFILVFLAKKENVLGVIILSDEVDENAKDILQYFLNIGKKLFVLTGDNKLSSQQFLKKLGLDLAIQCQMTPLDKKDFIEERNEYVNVFIGDGINDAPALKVADVGIAIGKSGADVAVESSDAVFLNGGIVQLKYLFKLSLKTMKIIKSNIIWAFSYNLIAIPLAVAGKIHPIISALFMSLSSLIVVFNSLRIKFLKFNP
ncbi:heavy metal translocating P-type ATPase [Deferribacter thermophilus]|uniref:heavy metal translocating P-type ATPase n=1 Tax=Deferribacter thermophilus TaxID=53573 RepID=UPI003C284DB2